VTAVDLVRTARPLAVTGRGVVDLVEAAAHGPGFVRFEPAGIERTLADLWRDAERVARWIAAREGRGTRVGAFLSNTPDCPAAVFGVWRSDGTLVSLPSPGRGADLGAWVSQITRMCALADVGLVLVDEAYRDLLPPMPIAVATFQEAVAASGPPCDADGRGGLVQFTSGSLGRPKGVVLTPEAIGANILAIIERMGVERGDVACSWLPMSHDMGFVGMFLTCVAASAPEYGGSHLTLQTPESFLADPTTWLRICAEQGATLTTAPNFAFELACRTRAFLPDVDLSRLRMCITGAERVQASTLRRFADDFAGAGLDPAALCPAYGMAEATLAVTLVPPHVDWGERRLDRTALAAGVAAAGDRSDSPVSYVSNGPAVAGMRVRVVAEPGRDVGEVQVSGPSLLQRYLGDDLRLTPDGWLPTRDLGFLAGGELYLVGRADETIIVGGRNHYAADIEHAIQLADRHDLVRPGCLAAVPLEDGYALLAEPSAAQAATTLEAACRELAVTAVRRAGVRPSLVGFLPRGRLLKTPSGKVQRRPLAAAIARGELELLASVSLEGGGR
jgi:acyl-CoA synthetase (AMP-forming)/AMP-acid ligase II